MILMRIDSGLELGMVGLERNGKGMSYEVMTWRMRHEE